MKFCSLKDIRLNDKRKLYRLLREAGCGEYHSRKSLLKAYSFVSELTFKPARMGLIAYLRKKDKLSEEEFASQLEILTK